MINNFLSIYGIYYPSVTIETRVKWRIYVIYTPSGDFDPPTHYSIYMYRLAIDPCNASFFRCLIGIFLISKCAGSCWVGGRIHVMSLLWTCGTENDTTP